MKKTGYLVLLLAFMCHIAAAQPRERQERIHAIKVGYLTDKLQLTSEQAENSGRYTTAMKKSAAIRAESS